jgi:Protein of unknown function (DUF1559)
LPEPRRITSRVAVAALLFALWSIACAVPAIAMCWTWLLVPYLVFTAATLGCGIAGWTRVARRPERLRGRAWAGIAMGAVFAFYGVATYMTVYLRTQERAQRNASAEFLTAIDAGMRHFYMKHEHFPPAAIRDPAGRPLLSWRVAVLPILGQQELYDRFRLDEPWDSAHNHALLAEMPWFYAAPHRPDAVPPTTVYQVFVGPGTPFDPAAPPLRLEGTDFPVPVLELFLIVEAAQPIPWTKPDDLPYAPDCPVPPLGTVVKYTRPPLLFVPRPSRGMLATRAGAGVHWVDLDAIDDAILREHISHIDPE